MHIPFFGRHLSLKRHHSTTRRIGRVRWRCDGSRRCGLEQLEARNLLTATGIQGPDLDGVELSEHQQAASCLAGASSVITVTGQQTSRFKETGLADGTGVDATGAVWFGVDDSPVKIYDSANICFRNGEIAHDFPEDVAWDEAKSYHGMRLYNSPNIIVEGTRISNFGDGISVYEGSSNFTIRDVLIEDTHDDAIESDYLESGVIEDTLIDGSYVTFAAPPRSSDPVDGSQNTWVINNSLARLRPQIGVYKGASPGHGGFFKWDELGPQLEIHNSIFRVDQLPSHGSLGIPDGKLSSCSNNTMVWLGQGEFPEALPSCFTITQDVSVWDDAAAQWRLDHGFSDPPAIAPTADLDDPTSGSSIDLTVLNTRGYIDVSFSDFGGGGLAVSSITDASPEFTFGGAAAAGVLIDGAAVLQSAATYRYQFSGSFGVGSVSVDFLAGSFEYNNAMSNDSESESFMVSGDIVAPSADLADPIDGAAIDMTALNNRGYIDVNFADTGGSGLNTNSVTDAGDEFTLGGSAALGVTVDGAATLVRGTTYRYLFTGSFAEGPVNVEFTPGSFEDLATTPNINIADIEIFTVQSPPAFLIMDNGDVGFDIQGNWKYVAEPNNSGYQTDIHHSKTGSGEDIATWTFTGMAVGVYEVAVTWNASDNRATNSPFTILDGTTPVYATTVDQTLTPSADYVEDGVPFQIVTSAVTISSGTLVVQLNDAANGFVIADAVRVDQATSGFDTISPTADLTDPTDGVTIDQTLLNTRGYIDVTFEDTGGSGLDSGSITDSGNEFTLAGSAAVGVAVDGAAVPLGGTTYRYLFTGSFAQGTVNVDFAAGSFQDLASIANTNVAESEDFTVQQAPMAATILDNGDEGFAAVGEWKHQTNPNTQGYLSGIHYSKDGSGADVATWSFTGLAPGDYEVSVTWNASGNRATNTPFTILDGTTPIFGATINQKQSPDADHVKGGVNFQIISSAVTISSGTLVVRLTDNADGFVVADAVRIQPSPPAPAPILLSATPSDEQTVVRIYPATQVDDNGGVESIPAAKFEKIWETFAKYEGAPDSLPPHGAAISQRLEFKIDLSVYDRAVLELTDFYHKLVWENLDWDFEPPGLAGRHL